MRYILCTLLVVGTLVALIVHPAFATVMLIAYAVYEFEL